MSRAAETATCHCAGVALHPAEVSVITPVAALYDPAMFPIVTGTLVTDSTSCPEAKLPVIDTLPEVSVALSRSANVGSASSRDRVQISVDVGSVQKDSTDASFTAATFTVLVTVFEFAVPSFTVKLTVRALVDGLSELLEYCTARSATCHCASVAVLPAEVSVITPVAALYAPAMLPIVAGTL